MFNYLANPAVQIHLGMAYRAPWAFLRYHLPNGLDYMQGSSLVYRT